MLYLLFAVTSTFSSIRHLFVHVCCGNDVLQFLYTSINVIAFSANTFLSMDDLAVRLLHITVFFCLGAGEGSLFSIYN